MPEQVTTSTPKQLPHVPQVGPLIPFWLPYSAYLSLFRDPSRPSEGTGGVLEDRHN